MEPLNILKEIQAFLSVRLHQTPMAYSSTLSDLAGCEVFLKAELFQKTGSYKPRGMLWALDQLSPEQRRGGVITFSAGNAAQGLAFAATALGIRATVVMPAKASPTKAEAAKGYGAEVILHGTPAECFEHCLALAAERGATFISSYDDDNLMRGHSSLGLEVLEQLPDTRAIYVGIGGGGMAGGLVKAVEALQSPVELIGVEPRGAPAMSRSLAAGRAVKLDAVNTVADGLAAPSAGELCYPLVQRRFEDIVVVEDSDIINSMKRLMSRCKLFAEPAGSAALAGLLSSAGRWRKSDQVVVIVSGGNLDFDRLKAML